LLLEGFPDRIARHCGEGIYQFPSGRLASLPNDKIKSFAKFPKWIIATDVDAGEREGRIRSYENPDEKEAEIWLSGHSRRVIEVCFSPGKGNINSSIKKTENEMYGKLLLSERQLDSKSEDFPEAFCAYIRKAGLIALPWSASCRSFLLRSRFWCLHKTGNSTEESIFDDQSLLQDLELWLKPFISSVNTLTSETLLDALHFRGETSDIEKQVPIRINLSNGISRQLSYEELDPEEGPIPILEIKIQELFGCIDTPRVMNIPVLLRLLSPARRPLQITRDLAGFWKNTWPDIIREMKGRYPKHKWPENPCSVKDG